MFFAKKPPPIPPRPPLGLDGLPSLVPHTHMHNLFARGEFVNVVRAGVGGGRCRPSPMGLLRPSGGAIASEHVCLLGHRIGRDSCPLTCRGE